MNEDETQKDKKRCILISIFLLMILVTVTIQISIRNDITPGNVFSENIYDPEGSWTVEKSKEGSSVNFTCQLSEREFSENILVLRSHWKSYKILVDKKEIYSAESKWTGSMHLFKLPRGKTLMICFRGGNNRSKKAIMQSLIRLGDQNGVYSTIIKKNLYAGIFMVITFLFGTVILFMGFLMGAVWSKDMCRSLKYLGIYILCTGCWILTDSQLLLLVTQKTEIVDLISFLAFFSMPLPLLAFTKKLVRQNETTFRNFQYLFFIMELLYVINYVFQFIPVTVIIVAEHLLMAATIAMVLYGGFTELQKHANRKLYRVMLGYIIFSVFSVIAFGFFYTGRNSGYSICYVTGILGFIFFLTDAACLEIYEQFRENANIAFYAELAYRDMLTGLGNRSGFEKENEENENYRGALAYIMVDANNLKEINDSKGHQKGDELLRQIGECIRKGVDSCGNCYRIGGDEFVICIKGRSGKEVDQVIKRIQKEIQIADLKSDMKISAAIGSAWTDAKNKNLQVLFKQADKAMYRNKEKMKQEQVNVK